MQLASTLHIPITPGIYIFKDYKGVILYIGKAKNLKNRVQQYFTPGSVWKQEMVVKAETIEYFEVSSEGDALTLEENLIKQHLPEYNKLLKYNSNHTFIKFTKEDFPAVTLSRTRYKDRSTYIGPKQNTKELRKLLQYLRQIFKYRTTSSTEFQKGVLTTDFYLGLDAGWSIIAKMKQKNGDVYIQQAQQLGFNLEKSYEAYIQDYKSIIKTMQDFFEGNTKTILAQVEKEIHTAASKQQFERCAQLRDMYRYIQTLGEKQEVVFSQPVQGKVIWIEQIHSYWVVIFVNFFDGKIIDIIRERKPVEELDINALVSVCKAEFAVQEYPNKNSLVDNTALLSSLDRKLNKEEYTALSTLLEKFVQSYISSTLFEEDNLINAILIGLKERYRLSKVPFHIECIDISHLSGGWISGGLSCYKSGVPYPKGYRRYKIQTVGADGQSDDYQSLREVVTRRMLTQPYPDLLIIDGGKGQLNAVYERLTKIFATSLGKEGVESVGSRIPFDLISIGKGEARERAGKNKGLTEYIYTMTEKGIVEMPFVYDTLDRVLVQVRDASHNFANAYRKKQMQKELG